MSLAAAPRPFPALLQAPGLSTGGPPPRLCSQLPLRVEGPPGGLASSLILHLEEPLVQGEVVPDRVLEQEDWHIKKKIMMYLPPCGACRVGSLAKVGNVCNHPVVDLGKSETPLCRLCDSLQDLGQLQRLPDLISNNSQVKVLPS